MQEINGLTFIKTTTWDQVFSDWREREKDHWGWEEHFKKRGMKSWDEWREKIIAPFKLQDRKWEIYSIDDPSSTISDLWSGGFPGWKKYYPKGIKKIQFKDLVKNPEVKKNPKVAQILENFPKETTIIAAHRNGQLIIVEGMHRACAIAITAREGRQLATKLTIAITTFSSDEKELFELARTQKEESQWRVAKKDEIN